MVEAVIRIDRSDGPTPALALGLRVVSEWDRADASLVGEATAADAMAFDNFMQAELREFTSRAAILLREHVAITVEARRPSF